jgi:hypothetical protein
MPPRRNQKDDAAAAAPLPTPRTQGTIRQSVPQYTIADEDEQEQRDTPYPTPQDRSNEISGTTSEYSGSMMTILGPPVNLNLLLRNEQENSRFATPRSLMITTVIL